MRHHWIKIEVVDGRTMPQTCGRGRGGRAGTAAGDRTLGGHRQMDGHEGRHSSIFYLSTLIISASAAALFPTQSSTEHPVAPWQRPEGRAASPLLRAGLAYQTLFVRPPSCRHPVVPRGAEAAE